MAVARRRALAIAAFLCFAASVIGASGARGADLFLNDEPEVYAAIDRLSALGSLPFLIANTRPYSVRAIRAAVARIPRDARLTGFDAQVLRWLRAYVAPKQMGRLTVSAAHADAREIPQNAEGIPVPKGWSGLGAVAVREQTLPWVNGQVRFTSFHGERGDEGNRLLDSSLELGVPSLAVQAGKISTWYGPGRHGALIFTNNAAPYPGVRIHDPVPILLPDPVAFLGSFQYDAFVARMEKKAHFSHSLLVGTRVALRPSAYLELGLSRALHYGGAGRDDGISEFVDDYFDDPDASGRANALTGFDVTLSIPFSVQPVQAYWESAVEDSGQIGSVFLPWAGRGAHLLGLFFPRVFRLSRLDLRVEYADTFSGEAKAENWYGNVAYPHRYRGQILGHAMGGGARDWFVEPRWHFSPDSYASLSVERLLRDGSSARAERRTILSAGVIGWLTDSWRAEAHASWNRVTDEAGVPGRGGADVAAWFTLAWQTNTLVPPDTETREVPTRDIRGGETWW